MPMMQRDDEVHLQERPLFPIQMSSLITCLGALPYEFQLG
jgi:hypothetical protein